MVHLSSPSLRLFSNSLSVRYRYDTDVLQSHHIILRRNLNIVVTLHIALAYYIYRATPRWSVCI